MRRFPTWAKIAIPIVLLLVLVAATATRILLTKLPDHTQQTIAERYREQLDALEQLADSSPLDPCEEMEPGEIMDRLEAIRGWQKQVEENGELFADPDRLFVPGRRRKRRRPRRDQSLELADA